MKRFLALLMTLLCLTSFAMAEDGVSFTATGRAEVSFEAHSAVITLHISASGDTLADAEKLAASDLATLKSTVMGMGVQAADIAIRRTDVQNMNEYHYSKLQQPSMVPIGAQVAYQMTAVLTDVTKLDALLDAVVLTGAYESYAVALLGPSAEAYEEALGLAVQDGLTKAKAMAKACGLKDVALENVTETEQAVDGLTVTATVEVRVEAR